METHTDPQIVHDRPGFMALAARHYENFPVGSFLVPRQLRPHIHRIYAFARTADDIADEHKDAAALQEYRESFIAHLRGAAAHKVPLFADLGTTIAERDLPRQLFLDLLDAFAQDLEVRRYADGEQLFAYCRKSADPIGRLVLRVFGETTPQCDKLSDQICTALQLLNHLQDIQEDLVERDRIYFPMLDLTRFGVAEEDLRARSANKQVRALVEHWTDRVGAMFAAGWPLTEHVGSRLRMELRGILHGAGRVLARIRAVDHDVLRYHIRLSRWQKLRILGSALVGTGMPRDFQ
ncbi:MAG: squalene synthase HpnC [Planctomycetota bacterium]|jgi:squalene synthase HpnC